MNKRSNAKVSIKNDGGVVDVTEDVAPINPCKFVTWVRGNLERLVGVVSEVRDHRVRRSAPLRRRRGMTCNLCVRTNLRRMPPEQTI